MVVLDAKVIEWRVGVCFGGILDLGAVCDFRVLASEDRIRLLIVSTACSEIESYYYLLVYVHTVYIHANTCT